MSSSILSNVNSDVQSNILFQCCVCKRVFLCVLDCIHKCLAALSSVINICKVRTCGNRKKCKENGKSKKQKEKRIFSIEVFFLIFFYYYFSFVCIFSKMFRSCQEFEASLNSSVIPFRYPFIDQMIIIN